MKTHDYFWSEIPKIIEDLEVRFLTIASNDPQPRQVPNSCMRGAAQIFFSVALQKMYELQNNENMDLETRGKMVFEFGLKMIKLVKIYTNVDIKNLFD